MVFQQFNLWPHKNVLHNITEAPIIVRGVSRAQAELDTSGDTIERSFEKLQALVKLWFDGKRDFARPSERRIETGAGGL